MNREEVMTRLQTVFDDVFLEPVKLSPQLTAKDVPEWTSLAHISLLLSVEKEFGIRFRVGEVEKMQNIGEFVDLILERLKEH